MLASSIAPRARNNPRFARTNKWTRGLTRGSSLCAFLTSFELETEGYRGTTCDGTVRTEVLCFLSNVGFVYSCGNSMRICSLRVPVSMLEKLQIFFWLFSNDERWTVWVYLSGWEKYAYFFFASSSFYVGRIVNFIFIFER